MRESLRSLNQTEKAQLRRDLRLRVDELDDVEAEVLLTTWELWARPEQLPPSGPWVYWVLLAGRGYGKTRSGAEWVRDSVASGRFQLVNLIGATADDARDIMIEGESGILATCPRWERPEYLPSKRRLDWPNGAKSLIFTADEPDRLRGKQHQRVWADELAAWRYEESWTQLKLGLRLPPEPRALVTTTPKPVAFLRDLLERPRLIVTKGTTYDNRENLAPEFFDEVIQQYEGTRLGRQELLAEILLDEGLAYRLIQGVHVIPPLVIPEWWQRFEAMDYGSTAPSAWAPFAVDQDGNIVVFDLYYQPGLIADQARAILNLRRTWKTSVCYAPADIKTTWPKRDIHGNEIGPETEFADHGITFVPAQQDRRAGYQRVAEMLRCVEGRRFPDWHPLGGQQAAQLGAPRLFILDTPNLAPLIKQLRDAPLEDVESPASRFPGEAVDQAWEHQHGHAHAMLRYGLMSRPSPSQVPLAIPTDPRARLLWLEERKRDRPTRGSSYSWNGG